MGKLTNPFRVEQRVRFSNYAIAANLWTQRKAHPDGWKGTMIELRGPLGVRVRRDGYATAGDYHVRFWEPLRRRSTAPGRAIHAKT